MMAFGTGLVPSLPIILGFYVINSFCFLSTPKYPSHSHPCYNLTEGNTVNCSGVGFSKFPTDLPSSVRVLDLSFNHIDSLPTPGSLAYLENLKILILRGNSYQGPIGPKAFFGLRTLETIDFSYNSITSLHNDSFYGCDHLLTLDLTGNKGITVIPSFNSSSIQIMFLDHCDIANPGTKPLPSSLEKLFLRGNPITEMPSITGQNLKVLDMRSCSLTIVHRTSLQNVPFLTRLYVSKNAGLTSLFEVRSESLRVIDAEDCNIGSSEIKGRKGTAIPISPLASMSGLTHAHLAGNRIKSIGPNSFYSNGNLVHLDLSRNGLELITRDSLSRLGKLSNVNISFNALKSLDEATFSANHFLEILDLSHNEHLTHLPAFDAASLRLLLASRCDISGIGIKGEGNPLAHMPSLEYLDLSRNSLENLPKEMSSQGLQHLDLSFCRISVVESRTLKGLNHLLWLDLRGNRIAYLDPDALRGLKYLALSDNPWKCDCDNPRFQQLWTVVERLEPKGQPLHCAPPTDQRKLGKVKEAPGEGLQLWQDVCPRASHSGPPVPASSMWTLSVAMVLTVAALMVGAVVIRHWIKEKKLRREAAEAEDQTTRRRFRRRRGVRLGAAGEGCEDGERGGEGRPTRDVVTVRRLREEPLPPSYEEAVLMPRPHEVEVLLEVEEERRAAETVAEGAAEGSADGGSAAGGSAEQGAEATGRDEETSHSSGDS